MKKRIKLQNASAALDKVGSSSAILDGPGIPKSLSTGITVISLPFHSSVGMHLIPQCSYFEVQPLVGIPFQKGELYYFNNSNGNMILQQLFTIPLQYGGLGWNAFPVVTGYPALLVFYGIPPGPGVSAATLYYY